MKKIWTITGLIALVAVVGIVGVTAVLAQGPGTPDVVPGSGQQVGQVGGSGTGLGLNAVDEAEMHAALAEALGMSVADFETAIANGETLYTLAAAQGVDFAELQAVMASLHDTGPRSAMNGSANQSQMNAMHSHQGGQGGQPAGQGQGPMSQSAAGTGNMTRGGQHGAQGNGGDCIYANQ